MEWKLWIEELRDLDPLDYYDGCGIGVEEMKARLETIMQVLQETDPDDPEHELARSTAGKYNWMIRWGPWHQWRRQAKERSDDKKYWIMLSYGNRYSDEDQTAYYFRTERELVAFFRGLTDLDAYIPAELERYDDGDFSLDSPEEVRAYRLAVSEFAGVRKVMAGGRFGLLSEQDRDVPREIKLLCFSRLRRVWRKPSACPETPEASEESIASSENTADIARHGPVDEEQLNWMLRRLKGGHSPEEEAPSGSLGDE